MIRDEEILAAIRESDITPEQLEGMLTKNAILVTVEEKRADEAELAQLEAQAAQSL